MTGTRQTSDGVVQTSAGVATTSGTVLIDSYEDGNLTEYDRTDEFDVFAPSGFSAVDEANVLRNHAGQGYSKTYSTSGLPAYFSKGQRAHAYARASDVDGSLRVLFGVADSNNNYAAQLLFGSQAIVLSVLDNGAYSTMASASASLSADQWYELDIVRDDGTLGGSDNDIGLMISTHPGGSQVGDTLVVNDNTHATASGVGMVGQSNDTADLYLDYYHRY